MFFLLTKSFLLLRFTLLLCLFCGAQIVARAETLDLRLEIASVSPARVIVSGKFAASPNSAAAAQKRWLFLDAYADAVDLSRRFSKQEFFDSDNAPIASGTKAANEFVTARPAVAWKYEVALEMPKEAVSAAHVSWLRDSHGLLMLADLLPQFETEEKMSARVRISLPAGWKIATVENKTGDNEFSVADAEKAVFLVGKDFTERTARLGKTEFRFAIEGKWSFMPEDAATMSNEILDEYRRTFGEIPQQKFQLILLPLPANLHSDRWRAETRGATIVLLSGAIAFKSIAVNRLHEQLRHEIFHFWIPNALNLSGQYDWFYEGFTLYQALKTGVRLNYIRFEDFLDALSRAINAANAAQNVSRHSLVETSRERWRGGGNLIYAKGMAAAFLCDAALLNKTGGKNSVSDVFREIYRKHNRSIERIDGNAAALAVLKNRGEISEVVIKFIEQPNPIDLKILFESSGLVNVSGASLIKLGVNPNLNGRQKKVLEKLGYKSN